MIPSQAIDGDGVLALDDPRLREVARAIGASPCSSVFLSPHWFRAATATWSRQPGVDSWVQCVAGGDRAGWAIIGRRPEVRHHMVHSRVLHLNTTGDPACDIVFPEYNGIFGIDDARFEPAFDDLLGRLARDEAWDELRLPGLTEERTRVVLDVAGRHDLTAEIEQSRAGYAVDLEALRNGGRQFIDTRSSNTRQQMRRARRQLEGAEGGLRLEVAPSAAAACAWFDACAPLHRRRWVETGSGFDSAAFVAFHHALIKDAFDGGAVQMMRVLAGERPFAYLYNFACGGESAFYLSAIDYEIGESMRPGMLAHWLAIDHNLAVGMRRYDFMTGESRYKRSLSSETYQQHWLVVRRKRVALLAERALKALRDRLVAGPPAPRASPG